jgi:biopolymer transport protein ExbB
MKHWLKLTALLVASLTLALAPLAAQDDAKPAKGKAKKTEARDKSLLDYYHEGGPVMHLISLCFVASLAISGFCAYQYRAQRLLPQPVVDAMNRAMSDRDVSTAGQLCAANPGPLGRALASALLKANFERDMFNKHVMENSLADSVFHEETKMMVVVNYLNTFAVLAPMIGLLGTTSGMISSFSALTAGRAEASDLAGGIGEALVATFGGLLLAIPAMFLYFFFRGKVQTLMVDLHKTVQTMLDLFTGEVTLDMLQRTTPGKPATPQA